MKTTKHPTELTDNEAARIVEAFDNAPADTYVVTGHETLAELRAAAARREAESRIEAAALRAHRDGASWRLIGTQLGMTRQGTGQRFEPLANP